MNATGTKTARLAPLAIAAITTEAGAKRQQAARTFCEAGGHAGYSARKGTNLYRRADGRRVASLMEALESYR